MNADKPKQQPVPKADLARPAQAEGRPGFAWPWGLVAIGIMALAWVGIYLVWNGVVFLFSR